MDSKGGKPLQRIEMRKSLSNFTINHPLSSPFSKQSAIMRSFSDTRLNHDYRELVREKERDRPTPNSWQNYKTNYNVLDNDYWFDQYSQTPKFWPTYNRVRQTFRAPTYDYYFYYPQKTIFPKFNRWSYADTLDVRYWRQYRDPYYDQPLWFPNKPWVYESRDTLQAVKMFRQKLVNLQDMNRYWLNPYLAEHKNGYTSYLQRPLFNPINFPRPRAHFYDTTVY